MPFDAVCTGGIPAVFSRCLFSDECGTTYTVRSGDTLDDIADKCNTTLAALIGANPWIGDPGVLDVGWILYLPEEFEETPTAVLAPDSGSAGIDVTLSVDGFVPYAPLNVALRSVDNTAVSWADEVDADADGSIRIDVRIPASALPGERWVVDAENPHTGVRTTSNSFTVTE
ncbi:MAG: LysM peptidoglycan-binding domain-containing protein [Anaerolineae bacterium]|nr:LysM peptidoglycan-binding domain-containing protein [Anaerolineae bacterium]